MPAGKPARDLDVSSGGATSSIRLMYYGAVTAADPARPHLPPVCGFADGAAALRFGVLFLSRRRDLWSLALAPILLTLVLGFVGGCAGCWLGFTVTQRYVPSASGFGGLLVLGLAVLMAAAAGLLGLLLGTSLAVPLSGPALERIAAAARQHLGLPPPPGGLGAGLRGFAASLATTALTWLVGIVGLGTLAVLTLVFPPAALVLLPLKGALLALLLTFDLGDPAFTLGGLSLGQRLTWGRAHLGAALGFGVLAMALSCVPLLGLLVLPAAVAGAARLTAQVAQDRP